MIQYRGKAIYWIRENTPNFIRASLIKGLIFTLAGVNDIPMSPIHLPTSPEYSPTSPSDCSSV